MDEYAYVVTYLKWDLDLPLPLGEQWTDAGKTYSWIFQVL